MDLGPATRAEIASATLLGGYYLRLTGPVEEPYLEALPGADPRRRIPLERTTAPLSLVGTLSDTTRQVQALDIDAINDVLAQLAGGIASPLSGLAGTLSNLIGGLARSLAALQAQREAEAPAE